MATLAVLQPMQPAVPIPSSDWMNTFSHGPTKKDKGWSFQKCPRFCEDGTSRIQNFINLDESAPFAQRHPSMLRSAPADLDTNTHPKVQERLCERVHQAPELAAAVQATPKKVATVNSHACRYMVDRAWLGNDTRFPHLHDPYAKKLGPGSYYPERSASPNSKAQMRNTAAFNAPERDSEKYLGPFIKGPSAVYIDPDVGHDMMRTPSIGHALRGIDARDWRYAARCTEAKAQQGFREPQNGGGWDVDKTGHSTSMASSSSLTGHNVAGVAMQSAAPRLVILPHERTGDSRIAHCTEHEQLYPTSSNLGPGAYGRMTSKGAGKKSYRLYTSVNELPSDKSKARDSKMPKLMSSLSKIEQRHKSQAGQPMNSAQVQALAASIAL